MVNVDSETLFNVAAAVVSTIAVVFFVVNVDFRYSPVSEVALVVLFLAVVFFLTQRTTDYQLTVLGYGVIVTSVVALFFDVANTFRIGNVPTVAGLLVVAALLFGLRTQLDEESRFVAPSTARSALGVVAVLTAGVLLADVVTGGLTYELQPAAEVQYEDSRYEERRAQIASVVATNPTPFPERVEAPSYEACASGNWSEFALSPDPGADEPQREVRAHASVRDGYGEYVFGYGSETYPVELHVSGADVRGETFPVRRTSTCPDEETGSPYVAVFEVPDDRPGVRPV